MIIKAFKTLHIHRIIIDIIRKHTCQTFFHLPVIHVHTILIHGYHISILAAMFHAHLLQILRRTMRVNPIFLCKSFIYFSRQMLQYICAFLMQIFQILRIISFLTGKIIRHDILVLQLCNINIQFQRMKYLLKAKALIVFFPFRHQKRKRSAVLFHICKHALHHFVHDALLPIFRFHSHSDYVIAQFLFPFYLHLIRIQMNHACQHIPLISK